jgi:hypothetical protein
LEIEKLPASGNWFTIRLDGYTQEQLSAHVMMAHDAGFVEAKFLPGTTEFLVKRLTYAGHEFVDAAREETLWNKAKDNVLSTAGTLTLEALKIALSALMQQAARGMIA